MDSWTIVIYDICYSLRFLTPADIPASLGLHERYRKKHERMGGRWRFLVLACTRSVLF